MAIADEEKENFPYFLILFLIFISLFIYLFIRFPWRFLSTFPADRVSVFKILEFLLLIKFYK